MAFFKPKSTTDYFEMFRKSAQIVARAAISMQHAFISGEVDKDELAEIKSIEHEGDALMHEALRQIEQAFITPLDQDAMLAILQALERVTDSIDSIARHLYMMHIRRSNQYIDQFVQLLVQATSAIQSLCNIFHDYERRPEAVRQYVLEINQCEESADAVYLDAMYELYGGEFEALDVLRLQTIYNKLEDALDCCEDVADIVEGILVSQ